MKVSDLQHIRSVAKPTRAGLVPWWPTICPAACFSSPVSYRFIVKTVRVVTIPRLKAASTLRVAVTYRAMPLIDTALKWAYLPVGRTGQS